MKIQVCNAPQNVELFMLIIKTSMLLLNFGVLIEMATNYSKWMKRQIRAWGPVLYLSAAVFLSLLPSLKASWENAYCMVELRALIERP